MYIMYCRPETSPQPSDPADETTHHPEPDYINLSALRRQALSRHSELDLFPNVIAYASTSSILQLLYLRRSAGDLGQLSQLSHLENNRDQQQQVWLRHHQGGKKQQMLRRSAGDLGQLSQLSQLQDGRNNQQQLLKRQQQTVLLLKQQQLLVKQLRQRQRLLTTYSGIL